MSRQTSRPRLYIRFRAIRIAFNEDISNPIFLLMCYEYCSNTILFKFIKNENINDLQELIFNGFERMWIGFSYETRLPISKITITNGFDYLPENYKELILGQINSPFKTFKVNKNFFIEKIGDYSDINTIKTYISEKEVYSVISSIAHRQFHNISKEKLLEIIKQKLKIKYLHEISTDLRIDYS